MNTINLHEEEPNKKKTGFQLRPTQVLALGFAGFIMAGAFLLSLPVATVNGQGAPFLTALFTSTSAVCVTGLVVVDTGTYFTIFGQLVILFLIQVGGLGFMTFATFFAIIMGRRIGLKERILLQEAYNQLNMEGIVRLAKYVIQMTIIIELLGAAILALRLIPNLGFGQGLYFGIFHAVSGFNNAGFDLMGEFRSFTGYAGDPIVNICLSLLIILGGLGFMVLSELYLNRGKKLHLHSYIVLKASALLIILGTVIFFALEYFNPRTLAGLEPMDRLLASYFQSVTTRTAGFNTIAISDLRDTTLLFIIIFMFIGASPGSTGGGIKTTTFVAVILSVITSLNGKNVVSIKERTLPGDMVRKALTITLLALFLILLVTGLLTITEDQDFLSLLFEVTSAFGTVGLSTGVTPHLTQIGRIAIMLTMFVGRVGPLTLAFALAQKSKIEQAHIKYPEERILIG